MVSLKVARALEDRRGSSAGNFASGRIWGVGVGPRFANCRRMGRRETNEWRVDSSDRVSGYVIQEIVGLTGWLGEKRQEGEKVRKSRTKRRRWDKRRVDVTGGIPWRVGGSGVRFLELGSRLAVVPGQKGGSTSNQFPKSAHCGRRGFALASLHLGRPGKPGSSLT
jgi:hypothetical protein